jgi:hypothetical protein
MITAAAVLCVAAPTAALANDAYEPNDSYSTATGPVVAGQTYAAHLPSPGDDDIFVLRGSGTITINANVTRDPCNDGAPALNYALWAKDAYGGEYGSVDTVGGNSKSFQIETDRDYHLTFTTASANDVNCTDRSVDYNFSVDGALKGGGSTGGGGDGGSTPPPSGGPKRLSSRPAYRGYACLYRSSGYTGFEDPPFRFTLKKRGVWIDRSTAQRVKARYKWKSRKLTLYSKRGSRLHTFAHFRDSSGKYLRQHPVPKNNNPLICR